MKRWKWLVVTVVVLLAAGGGLYLLVRDLPPPEDADLWPRGGPPFGEDVPPLVEAACPEEDLEEEGKHLRCLRDLARRLLQEADEAWDAGRLEEAAEAYLRGLRWGRSLEASARSLLGWATGSEIVQSAWEGLRRVVRVMPDRVLRELDGLPDPRAGLAEAMRHDYIQSVRMLESFRREVDDKPWPLRLLYRHGRTMRLLHEMYRTGLRDLERPQVLRETPWNTLCTPRAPAGGLFNFYGRTLIGKFCPNWEALRVSLYREEAMVALLRGAAVVLIYRREWGYWPERPEALPGWPVDPYDGAHLRYQAGRIWSKGLKDMAVVLEEKAAE